RGARLRRRRILAQVLLPGLDRLLRVVLRLRQLGALDAHRAALAARAWRALLDRLEQRHQLAALALRRVVRAVEVERGGVARLALSHAAGAIPGPLAIAAA